jgi:hypothetical protein
MRVDIWLYAVVGLANASALNLRDSESKAVADAGGSGADSGYSSKSWRPKTTNPQFFSLKVDDLCKTGEAATACPFSGYAIRLWDSKVIATPYNRWWDPKLPIFFVDDDTKAYTVSPKRSPSGRAAELPPGEL